MKIVSAEFVKGVVGTDPILSDGIPQIAFVGRSNVGKSSVINSLVYRNDLVKVGKKPGKTTEINFFKVNNQFYFVDLPGYGYAKVSPEMKDTIKERILWYVLESGVKPLTIALILDVKAGCTSFDIEMLEFLRQKGHSYLIVVNKIDKLNQKELAEQVEKIKRDSLESEVFLYSAQEKTGREELLTLLTTSS